MDLKNQNRNTHGGESPDSQKTILRLYVAGDAPNSKMAVQNLENLRKSYPNGACETEIIDVLDAPERAVRDGILVTPTLLRVFPEPPVRIIGNLEEREQILEVLGLNGGQV